MVVRERLVGDIARERYGSYKHMTYDHMAYESNTKNNTLDNEHMTYAGDDKGGKEMETKKSSAMAKKTEFIADKLVKEYDAPTSRDFFLKCAWHLSEHTIWTAVEKSHRRGIKSPVKYFVKVCLIELDKLGF